MKNKFLETKEGSAFVKLSLWILFIVVLLIIFSFNKGTSNKIKNTTKEETTSFKSLEDMESNLLNKGLTYKYTISEIETITIYNGIRCNNVDTYYIEESDVISKFIKEGGKTYKVVLDKKEEVLEEEKTLEDLFTTLNEYSFTKETSDNQRIFKYNTGTFTASIKTDLENITDITVVKDGINYQMEFTNIGICDNIN